MSDIDTRLDDLIHWILNEPAYTPAQMKVKIKQLIEEEILIRAKSPQLELENK